MHDSLRPTRRGRWGRQSHGDPDTVGAVPASAGEAVMSRCQVKPDISLDVFCAILGRSCMYRVKQGHVDTLALLCGLHLICQVKSVSRSVLHDISGLCAAEILLANEADIFAVWRMRLNVRRRRRN